MFLNVIGQLFCLPTEGHFMCALWLLHKLRWRPGLVDCVRRTQTTQTSVPFDKCALSPATILLNIHYLGLPGWPNPGLTMPLNIPLPLNVRRTMSSPAPLPCPGASLSHSWPPPPADALRTRRNWAWRAGGDPPGVRRGGHSLATRPGVFLASLSAYLHSHPRLIAASSGQ